jgi:protein phosphatase
MILPTLKYQKLDIPNNKRVLVISDIHGHDSLFAALLDKASYTPDDVLIIVGDMVDKGKESLKTLRRIMKLSDSGNVVPLLGNVDARRLYMIDTIDEENTQSFYDFVVWQRKRHGTCFYEEMVNELGYSIETPEDILKAKSAVLHHFKSELNFIANLPTIAESDHYIFVHGGLREKAMEANRKRKLFDLLKYELFATTDIVFDKYVVVGHWPTTLYCKNHPCCNPIIDHEKHIVSIDGGCGIKEYGQLNMLILPNINCKSNELDFIYCDDLPTFIASEEQEESRDAIYINWMDNKIDVLHEEEEFSYCRHISSGKELWIYNGYISKDKKSCLDSTNYLLPVAKGDKLSMILQTSRGCLAKKDGVVGWYK